MPRGWGLGKFGHGLIILVRVVLQSQPPIGRSDLLQSGIWREPNDVVWSRRKGFTGWWLVRTTVLVLACVEEFQVSTLPPEKVGNVRDQKDRDAVGRRMEG